MILIRMVFYSSGKQEGLIMRIIMVTNNYTPYSGGVVSSLNALVPHLQALGHELLVVSLDFNGCHTDDPYYVKRVKTFVKFFYKKNYMALPWRAQKQLEQLIRQFNPDVIHVHHPFLLGAAALKVAQKLGKKIVFTYHTLYNAYAHYVPIVPIGFTQKCISNLVTSFCHKVDGIIVPTEGVQSLLPKAAKDRSIVIPSPVQEAFVMPRFIPKQTKNVFELLTVGRMVPEKNVPWLLDMFAKLDHDRFRFILIGYGSDYDQTRSYAYDILRFSSKVVHFVHKPAKEHLIHAYQKADLFVFSSQTDTQALVLAEGMSFGNPVVALNGIGQESIIQNGKNGYLVNSADEMVFHINMIANDSKLHAYLQENAFRTSNFYHPNAISQQIINYYRFILN